MKIHRFCLYVRKDFASYTEEARISFNFLMNLQYKKTNVMNQDEMGLPFHLICTLFCDRPLEHHSTNLEQGFDFKSHWKIQVNIKKAFFRNVC